MLSNPSVLIVVALVGVAFFILQNRGKTAPTDARRLVEEGALLVDVRSPGEFASGHLPGAKNIPLNVLGQRLKELGKPDTPIVLYCLSGARSGTAKRMLEANGFQAVHDLGAMRRWQ